MARGLADTGGFLRWQIIRWGGWIDGRSDEGVNAFFILEKSIKLLQSEEE